MLDPREAVERERGDVLARDGAQADVAGLGKQDGAHAYGQIRDARVLLAHMGEGVGEAGGVVDFQQHLGQLDAGQEIVHGGAQPPQAGRIVESLQRREGEPVAPAALLNPQVRIRRQVGGRAPIGLVELVPQRRQLHRRVERMVEGAADARPSRFPRRALQQRGARVGPLLARGDEEVATPERGLNLF
jgi:hypothetical protein